MSDPTPNAPAPLQPNAAPDTLTATAAEQNPALANKVKTLRKSALMILLLSKLL